MSLPRPLLFALFGALLIGAAFFASRGLTGTAAEPDTPAAEVAPAPEPEATPPQGPPAKPAKSEAKATEPVKAETKKVDTSASKPAEKKQSRASSPEKPATPKASVEQRIERAVKARTVVVAFFRQRGADDDAVARAVASVRGKKRVAVFTIPVGRSPKFTEALRGATVTRAPSIVIVGRDRQPRLIEGFIDSTTLAQAVADAR